MTAMDRMRWGCLGASAAVATSFVSLDLSVVQRGIDVLTKTAVAFYLIKYLVLLFLGGLLTYLREREEDKLNLLSLGAAAPTILVTLFNHQALTK